MSYRRQQLERELPEASKYLCEFLWRNLQECGVNLSPQDITLIVRLVVAYGSTPQGKHTFLHMLKALVKPASSLKTYFKAGFLNDESQKIKPSDLMEFHGWVYKKTASLRWDAIDIDEREDSVICDNCGGRFPEDYCTKTVEATKRTGELRTEVWCNHCRYQTENPRIKQTGEAKTCAECEKTICEFHPRHIAATMPGKAPVALLPQRAANDNLILPPGWEKP